MTGPLRVERNSATFDDTPHRLLIDNDRYAPFPAIAFLNDAEADAIERQLAGGTLRIVDVGGTGLPRWPDLTELREAVEIAKAAQIDPDPDVWLGALEVLFMDACGLVDGTDGAA